MPNLFQDSSDSVSFPTAKECVVLQEAHARRFLKTCDGLEEEIRNHASRGMFSCGYTIPDGARSVWIDLIKRNLRVLGYEVSDVLSTESGAVDGLIITWNHL